jgi:hypothetical protein
MFGLDAIATEKEGIAKRQERNRWINMKEETGRKKLNYGRNEGEEITKERR